MTGAILKYFYEEPVHLEALSAETDPDARRRAMPSLSLDEVLNPANYYRAYLAGSCCDRVGLTSIPGRAPFVAPLLDVFGTAGWVCADVDGDIELIDDAGAVLRDPSGLAALAVSAGSIDAAALGEVARVERRYGIPSLRRLLDAGATVLFPEPAHDGWDWSLFSAVPLRERLVAAFRAHPSDVRRFALPYRQARSEHKFYFERWQLDTLPDWIEDIG